MAEPRIAEIFRETKETKITLKLGLDGTGKSSIDTGIPFLDHMLELFSRHGLFDLEIKAEGDIQVDYHHTVEDIGIVLGQAVKEAVGDKAGINRYGFFILPMDECLARVAVDLSNRAIMVYNVDAKVLMVRDFNIGLLKEFFRSWADNAGANLHLILDYGDEPHHIAEALFKAFARALDMATQFDPRRGGDLPSTKGKL